MMRQNGHQQASCQQLPDKRPGEKRPISKCNVAHDNMSSISHHSKATLCCESNVQSLVKKRISIPMQAM